MTILKKIPHKATLAAVALMAMNAPTASHATSLITNLGTQGLSEALDTSTTLQFQDPKPVQTQGCTNLDRAIKSATEMLTYEKANVERIENNIKSEEAKKTAAENSIADSQRKIDAIDKEITPIVNKIRQLDPRSTFYDSLLEQYKAEIAALNKKKVDDQLNIIDQQRIITAAEEEIRKQKSELIGAKEKAEKAQKDLDNLKRLKERCEKKPLVEFKPTPEPKPRKY